MDLIPEQKTDESEEKTEESEQKTEETEETDENAEENADENEKITETSSESKSKQKQFFDQASYNAEVRTILLHVRECLVELFIALAKALFFWVPGGDVAKGKALMACHPIFLACVTALFFIVEPKSPLRFIIVGLAVITVASQWLLGGCVVTRAEQRLTGSKETILDPFLILAKISVNRDTRIAGTIGSGTAVCVILVWAFLCDIWHAR